ncbi:hypothetical protein VP01_2778g4 [Puccinia sorghi]|uniref:RTA1 like protein n=1 Tax=Puccinia sorghi TaxID=27349 RepID=A0A0L6V2T4_9BASI|nr:hypothetical protein VP01_2778g4 [Puccinia sorghi]
MSGIDQVPNQHHKLFTFQPSLILELGTGAELGCTFLAVECIGFVGRALLANPAHRWQLGLYIMETLLLLLAPTFFAGSIYMTFTRILRLTNGQKHCLLPATWLTKIFVSADAISFLLQAAGGGVYASANTMEQADRGRNLMIAGLALQLVTFCAFMMLAIVFYIRMKQKPTMSSETLNTTWKGHLIMLVTACCLIVVRSTFRLAKYVGAGPLMEKQIFTILLDSVLMFLCMLLFNLFHPSQALNEKSHHPTEIPILRTREKELLSPSSTQDCLV